MRGAFVPSVNVVMRMLSRKLGHCSTRMASTVEMMVALSTGS
jgi:hypothetical protein